MSYDTLRKFWDGCDFTIRECNRASVKIALEREKSLFIQNIHKEWRDMDEYGLVGQKMSKSNGARGFDYMYTLKLYVHEKNILQKFRYLIYLIQFN